MATPGKATTNKNFLNKPTIPEKQMNQEPLIIGIDPGTTLGYAVIDTKGRLIKKDSSKNLSLSILISKIIELGKIIAVATDKKKVPSFIKEFSIKIGARIISPKQDLKVLEKKRLSSKFETKDYHQMDALASALFAYKELTPLLKKIHDYTEDNKKERIKNRIIELVITKELSIKNAVELIEKPENEENQIIKRVIEEKNLEERDFLKVYSKLKKFEKENYLLKKQRDHLTSEMKGTKEEYSYMLRKISKFKIDKRSKELIKFKEKRIHFFDKKIKTKDYEASELRDEIKTLYSFLSNLSNNHLVKKLDNLGYTEFEKNKHLNIQKDDILLVDDPNIINDKVINQIRGKVSVIIHKKDISKRTIDLPFTFIQNRRLRITENNHLALVNKKDLEREKNQKNMITKVIKDYNQERVNSLKSI